MPGCTRGRYLSTSTSWLGNAIYRKSDAAPRSFTSVCDQRTQSAPSGLHPGSADAGDDSGAVKAGPDLRQPPARTRHIDRSLTVAPGGRVVFCVEDIIGCLFYVIHVLVQRHALSLCLLLTRREWRNTILVFQNWHLKRHQEAQAAANRRASLPFRPEINGHLSHILHPSFRDRSANPRNGAPIGSCTSKDFIPYGVTHLRKSYHKT